MLFRFLMRRVDLAFRTMLFHLQLFFQRLLVAGREIVGRLADFAFHFSQIVISFFRHNIWITNYLVLD